MNYEQAVSLAKGVCYHGLNEDDSETRKKLMHVQVYAGTGEIIASDVCSVFVGLVDRVPDSTLTPMLEHEAFEVAIGGPYVEGGLPCLDGWNTQRFDSKSMLESLRYGYSTAGDISKSVPCGMYDSEEGFGITVDNKPSGGATPIGPVLFGVDTIRFGKAIARAQAAGAETFTVAYGIAPSNIIVVGRCTYEVIAPYNWEGFDKYPLRRRTSVV